MNNTLESRILSYCRALSKEENRVIGMRESIGECVVMYLDTYDSPRFENDMYRTNAELLAMGWNPRVVLAHGENWAEVANALNLEEYEEV